MAWFRTFFKGRGVLVTVKKGPRGREVKISGAVARALRPKLHAFFASLPLEDAAIRFAVDAERRSWKIESSKGVDAGAEQRIRNFVANEM